MFEMAKINCRKQGYGFVEFLAEEDADYAIKIMNMIKLYGKPVRSVSIFQSVDHQLQQAHID